MKQNKIFLLLFSITFIFGPTQTTFAAEGSVYDFSWLDKDKEVYVLQNRKFRKDGKLTLGLTLGKSTNGAFIDSYEGNILASYFFKEDWGLEFVYTKANGETNSTHDSVEANGTVAYFKKIDTAMSFLLMWSPFYSKINTFNTVFYYDWLFGFGLANISTLNNGNKFTPGPDNDKLETEASSAFTWTTGFRFYISESWSTRLDFRAIHSNTEVQVTQSKEEERLLSYYNFNIGINYTF